MKGQATEHNTLYTTQIIINVKRNIQCLRTPELEQGNTKTWLQGLRQHRAWCKQDWCSMGFMLLSSKITTLSTLIMLGWLLCNNMSGGWLLVLSGCRKNNRLFPGRRWVFVALATQSWNWGGGYYENYMSKGRIPLKKKSAIARITSRNARKKTFSFQESFPNAIV